MTESDDPVGQILEAYKVAVYRKDVDAFMAIYDEDVAVFDMWGRWTLRGAKAWREMAVAWFSSVGTDLVVVSIADVSATRVGDLAVGHAILTFAAVSPEGKELRSLNNRITVALKKSGGAWKIFHEHTSAPIDPQSMKAMLRREPKV